MLIDSGIPRTCVSKTKNFDQTAQNCLVKNRLWGTNFKFKKIVKKQIS